MVRKAECRQKCIQTLSENPTKVEEIEFITAVARSIPENSYLKSFFTTDMVEKLIQDIQSDFCPDFETVVEKIINERLCLKRAEIEVQYKKMTEENAERTKKAEERAKKAEERAMSAEKEFQRIAGILEQIHHVTMGY